MIRSLSTIDRIYYSIKANSHLRVLETAVAAGLGIECVSAAEVLHARRVAGAEAPLLFTPNFCPLDEYATAMEAGAEVVVDGPEPLDAAPSVFGGRAVGLRIDTGNGLGHHLNVRTAGARSKFGHPREEMARLVAAVRRVGARVTGLHAHVGSGIFEPGAWAVTGRRLAALLGDLPEVEWLDLGGGLGVPERPDQAPLDLSAMQRELAPLRRELAGLELRLEPGRFLVSEAGVLVAPVTQVRRKAGVTYVGLATGMNSLLRPALYGAWHGIHNLSRLYERPVLICDVVGPICESGDVLGRQRSLPATRPGDLILIENAGAYGAVMSSGFNLRAPAEECVLES